MIRPFLLAMQFLTILPLRLQAVHSKDLAGSMAFYPLVGAILGMILSGIGFFLNVFPSRELGILLLLLFWVILTGGLHLDGLADTLDGFVGSNTRESTLTIMRDPTIGTMGALLSMQGKELVPGLIFVMASGRYLMVLGAFVSRYPHSQGIGKDYIGKIPTGIFAIASLVILLIAAATYQLKGLILLLASLGWAALWIVYSHRRIGGMTGDTLGALGEVSEAVLLVVLCAW